MIYLFFILSGFCLFGLCVCVCVGGCGVSGGVWGVCVCVCTVCVFNVLISFML